MRLRIRTLLVTAILLAPTILYAGAEQRAVPPLPDPVREDPAGFLQRFLEMIREFVAGLIGSAGV